MASKSASSNRNWSSLSCYHATDIRIKKLRLREKKYVASVTHELPTPLTVIHSAADNIKSGIVPSDRISQYGEMIINQSTRLSSMIEGILLFSRLEGKNEPPPQPGSIDFSEVKKNFGFFIQSFNNAANKNINIDFNSLPVSAFSDRNSIELILTNLLSNSCKHAYGVKGEGGSIRVMVHIKLPLSLIFIVEDDGSGIDKTERKHIFELFYRGRKSLKEQINVSGLGLYLSFRKARLLGGTLKLTSPYERPDGKIRKGSQFTLRIPYIVDDMEISK